MGSRPSPTCLSARCTQKRGDLSVPSLYLQDVQGSEHPQNCVGFGGGWCIRELLPGGTNAFQYSSVLQAGGGRGGRGEGALCWGLLLPAIYFMPTVANAVGFLPNVQCGIKTYEDKKPVFKTTAEAVTFQRALCTQRRQLWASQATLRAPGWWATLSQAVSRRCSFDLSEGCSSLHSSWAWPGVPKAPQEPTSSLRALPRPCWRPLKMRSRGGPHFWTCPVRKREIAVI